MLTLYANGGAIPLPYDDYYVRELASGLDELIFGVSIWDEFYPLIQEEASIQENSGGNPINYLVKAIDGGGDRATVKCQIDLDEWKSALSIGYNSGSKTVGAIARTVAPSGWTVSDESGLTYSRTIKLDAATPIDVLEQCRDTFPGVTFRFDNVNKVLYVINMIGGQNLGAFATRDLNLKQNNYKGKSSGFVTRLYAYGKDGLSFASINGGKPYVENHTYSSRVICAYWKDERYTVAENLLQAAQARLDALSVPQRSYDLSVVDLASADPQKYGYLAFSLFSIVSLIDDTRASTKIDHYVVERWVYPYLPQNNKVVLSTAPPRITSQVTQIINSLSNQNSIYQQQQSSAQQTAVENATAQITGAKGGNMRAIYDNDGDWTELVVMNTESILTATKLWRFNLGGFGYSPNGYNGPYITAITMDGAIVADFITTGTLDASKATVTNLNAGNISTGTLSADRIAADSISVGKLTGSISNGDWEIDLTAGTLTIGSISANSITAGTINADSINITNINGVNIKTGTIGSDPLGTGCVTNGKLGELSVSTGKIQANAVTGGSSGNLALSTITTSNTVSGINTNLGYAASYGQAIQGVDADNFACKVLTNTAAYMVFHGSYFYDTLITINGTAYHVLAHT